MKQGLFFLCLFILGLVCCLSSAHAIVYWDDDFESPLAGRWDYLEYAGSNSPSLYLDISTDEAHSGTHSLKLVYNPVKEYDDSQNVAIVRTFQQTDPTIWTRFYYRTNGFHYSPIATNHFYLGDVGVVALHSSGLQGMTLEVLVGQDCPGSAPDCYATWPVNPNQPAAAAVNLDDNIWHCIETQTTLDKPATLTMPAINAVLQLWVDGVSTLVYTNHIRGTSPTGTNGNSSLSAFNSIQILKQAGTGVIYLDQFAVGTARIGCTGGSADTTPPEVPIGLTIR